MDRKTSIHRVHGKVNFKLKQNLLTSRELSFNKAYTLFKLRIAYIVKQIDLTSVRVGSG